MSLLNIRRERRETHRGPDRPPQLWKLLLGLGIVAALLWYLTQFT
jgi:hypothetical protein